MHQNITCNSGHPHWTQKTIVDPPQTIAKSSHLLTGLGGGICGGILGISQVMPLIFKAMCLSPPPPIFIYYSINYLITHESKLRFRPCARIEQEENPGVSHSEECDPVSTRPQFARFLVALRFRKPMPRCVVCPALAEGLRLSPVRQHDLL